MLRTLASLGACLVLGASCMPSSQQQATSGSTSSSRAMANGDWRPLFDGSSLAAWRGYRSDTPPAGWRIEDGLLVRADGGGDLMTRDRFRDFELTAEWKISEGGNSGIMYRVTERGEHSYETGPEMQVLDDARHADGQSRLTAAGALYGLYPSPAGVVKPAGEWNQARIVVRGSHVEHWLNGVKVVDAEMNSPEWNEKVRNSKFSAWPGYGKSPEGHIVLQDHGDRVAYRNIRVRTLP